VEIGPIEEGCKLLAVVLTSAYLQRWHNLRPRHPSTVFLYTIAVALGFAAEENWVYLYYGTASIFDRLIGTPVHALFSAPWGYALAIATCSTFQLSPYWRLVAASWINAVICHALVNVLSSAWRYSPPISFLSYGLFPFLLWMFWRMMQLLRRVQDRPPITLISNTTPQQRYWHFSLAICALILGGNAIFGLFLLVRTLSPLSLSKLFYPDVLWFIVTRLGLNLILGILAWVIYRYLRYGANRR
jgi:RsiW-degrading membrane proteinase PrsW (M82 family)